MILYVTGLENFVGNIRQLKKQKQKQHIQGFTKNIWGLSLGSLPVAPHAHSVYELNKEK